MRLALLGDPVAHSLSPAIHGAAFAACGIDGIYEVRRVDTAGLDAAVGEVRDGSLHGANVTMPHKVAAAERCDVLEGVAGRLGVVNTLRMDGGALVGANTDAPGVADAFERRGLPGSGPVLILGAGGAARAALVALEGRDLAVATRRGRGAEMAAEIGVPAREVPWGQGVPGAVVVNATPLGMDAEPLPGAVLDGAVGLLDMPYGVRATPAVERARERGIPTADGIDLLVAQAARSFEVWTGRDAPIDAMEAAARSAAA